MILRELYIESFGQFKKTRILLGEGIHVIYGENETGKSTIHAFIKGMLFGIERQRGRAAKNDTYSTYEPWDQPNHYAGMIRFSCGDKTFRLERNFEKSRKETRLLCETDGEELSVEHGDLEMLLDGLTESTYDNTISIGQLKTYTDESLSAAVQNYMSNYEDAGDTQVDVATAIGSLKKQQRQLQVKYEKIKSQEQKKRHEIEVQCSYIQQEINSREQSKLETLRNYERAKEELKIEQNELKKGEKELQHALKELDRVSGLIGAWSDINDSKKTLDHRNFEENTEVPRRNGREEYLSYLFIIILVIISVNFLPSTGLKLGISLLGIIGMIFLWLIRKKSHRNVQNSKDRNVLDSKDGNVQTSEVRNVLTVKDRNIQTVKDRNVQDSKDRNNQTIKDRNETNININTVKQDHIISKESDETRIKSLKTSVEQWQAYLHTKKESLKIAVQNKDKLSWNLAKLEEELQESYIMQDNKKELLDEFMNVTVAEKDIQDKIASITLAIDTIKELSEDLAKEMGGALQREMSFVLKELTKGRYDHVKLDQQLGVTLYRGYQRIRLEQVSKGTVDQVYFALRMAVTKMFWNSQSMPLLFDESFAMYGENRLIQALFWLSNNSKQSLIFTCHKREEELLKREGIPHSMIQL